ncbi:MAG: hypothetical protein Kow0010_07620 [Dehalococcoidia bacterium]
MSYTDAANALLTAINFDRFNDIAALHAPDITFHSFRGPSLHDNSAVVEWQRAFLESYADCRYEEVEMFEDGDTVCARATISAKGYDWRLFHQRVVEVLRFNEDETVAERRLYGMLRDIEFDKAETAALKAATEFPGGNASEIRKLLDAFYAGVLAGDAAAKDQLDEKAVLIDSVYGSAEGPDAILDLLKQTPKPPFGILRVTGTFAGPKDGVVELAIEPARPRMADWVRVVEGKIKVIERYWMLREIGVNPLVEYSRDRHRRRVIMPA